MQLLASKGFRTLLVVLVLALGAYFRFTGLKWDADFHLHPDERFLTMVESSISPVGSLKEYFDTSRSSLNPHNVLDANGNQIYPLFVYGSLSIFLVRYLGEWLGMGGYGQIFILGRVLSGLFDVGTILLVFFIAQRLFHKYWLSLTAALLYACAALPIQISHYFIVDNFTTFFAMLAFLGGVIILKQETSTHSLIEPRNPFQWLKLHGRELRPYVGFGIALGLATASKINALAIAIVLPLALLLRDPKKLFNISDTKWTKNFYFLVVAFVFFFMTFRLFQPYAFKGPGFFGIAINKEWIGDLRELSLLSSGISNYPPSLQWARRSIAFPIKNMLVWGLGLPFGGFSIAGMIWMTLKIVQGKWKKYAFLWFWTAFYSGLQIVRWNPTMRYLLLVYPTLAICAAWFLYKTCQSLQTSSFLNSKKSLGILLQTIPTLTLVIGALGWAVAFIRIYQQPMTRIAASEWIYDHVEGAVNLRLDDASGSSLQAIPYGHALTLASVRPLRFRIQTTLEGSVTALHFDHIVRSSMNGENLRLKIRMSKAETNEIIGEWELHDLFLPDGDARGKDYRVEFGENIMLPAGENIEISIELLNSDQNLNFYGTLGLHYKVADMDIRKAVLEYSPLLESGSTMELGFSAKQDATLSAIELFRVKQIAEGQPDNTIAVRVIDRDSGAVLTTGQARINTDSPFDARGNRIVIKLEKPVRLVREHAYLLSLSLGPNSNSILITGSESAKETDWDDALPLFMYGLNPFDRNEGVYQSDLNFQMYWDDNGDKRARFITILDQADFIIITSSRQWGSVTQLPEKYPLSTLFYRELVGCPVEDVQWCYQTAAPGVFTGRLGYELAAVFQSNPAVLGLEFNSQFAEEAFTVYDHPKVFIFQKTDGFDLGSVSQALYQIDLSQVSSLSPEEVEKQKGNLMLSTSRLASQKQAGSWSDLFDYADFQNRYPGWTVLIWYVSITLLGWLFYPVGRLFFRGLADKGYPLYRLAGLVFWTFAVWWLGSNGMAVNRLPILGVLAGMAAINLGIAWKGRHELIEEIRENRSHYIRIELISLAFFLFFLMIRLGNPDLWHPYKGGEKPMDFAYFNAVLKSESFPPYDPWYAGGYINYYYYGFVLAAVPVKLLGIVPSVAYNLILPLFFSFSALAAYSFGWNLAIGVKDQASTWRNVRFSWLHSPHLAGMLSIFFVLIIGNLGTIVMILQGFMRIASAGVELAGTNIFNTVTLLIRGIDQFLQGSRFNYYPGDWYWIPSRAIPGESITEFPYFTFLYGDPHAHLFAYPLTLMALAWMLAILMGRQKTMVSSVFLFQLFAGALLVGVLRPTNTWDYPVFLVLALLVVGIKLMMNRKLPTRFFEYLPFVLRKGILTLLLLGSFCLLTLIAYQPFTNWFGQAYTAVDIWKGDRTPISSYLVHWGFFLFVISSYALWEMREWMAGTPVSALKPLYEKRQWLLAGLLLLICAVFGLAFWGVRIVWVIVLPGSLLLPLLFRKKSQILEKYVILLTMVGLGLTLMVELIAIRGDIGRMNTVFKFYLQAWTFLALSSAFYLHRLLPAVLVRWQRGQRRIWSGAFIILGVCVLLFPLIASNEKINDRMSSGVPLTLDGMEYMRYSNYPENDIIMDLSQDYEAIRWMQENVAGSPVIIEGSVGEYRWGNRFSIYTGLPGVIGWNWHQRQQRAMQPGDLVYSRVEDVNLFYATEDIDMTKELIAKYGLKYIVVGQLERAIYPDAGMAKFAEQEGLLWDTVYSSEGTKIFQVKINSDE